MIQFKKTIPAVLAIGAAAAMIGIAAPASACEEQTFAPIEQPIYAQPVAPAPVYSEPIYAPPVVAPPVYAPPVVTHVYTRPVVRRFVRPGLFARFRGARFGFGWRRW